MVSRCSHRISLAVQSDVKLWKSSRSRPHSSLPCKPLRSEPRQWSPNSAWHQSSQWFTSHSDHRVGSEHVYKRINLHLWRYWIFISSTPLIKAPMTELLCGGGGSICTLWKVTGDSLLGESSETGLNCLAEDLLAGRGERRDVQGVQLWDRNKISTLSCDDSFPFLYHKLSSACVPKYSIWFH